MVDTKAAESDEQIVEYAFAPLHNVTLPGRMLILAVGDFRILRVRPWRYRGARVPRRVMQEMFRSKILAPWAPILQQGYYSNRDITPKHVVYYFPRGRMAEKWMAEPLEALERAQAVFEAFTAALRLADSAYVSVTGSVGVGRVVNSGQYDGILSGTTSPRQTPMLPMLYNPKYLGAEEKVYLLNEERAEEIAELFKKTRRASTTRLSIALRRFVSSRDKGTVDRFIDLLVALEVLFGDNDPSSAGHKIAFRASVIAEANAADRRTTFDRLKRAYASRSAVLHGRTEGKVLSEADNVEAALRSCLRWFLDRTLREGSVPDGRAIDDICFQSAIAS